jgi:hypothetical protein
MLSNTEQCRKYLLRRAQAGAGVFAFGPPALGLLPIPGVSLVKFGEMPYYVLEIL